MLMRTPGYHLPPTGPRQFRRRAAWARGGSVNPAAPSRSSSQAAETAAPVSSSQPPEGDAGADFPGDRPSPEVERLIEEARTTAMQGMAAYQKFFGALSLPEKRTLADSGEHDKNKAAAEYADKSGGAQ